MISPLDREHVQAEISGLDALLESMPPNDYVARISLTSRRDRLRTELDQLAGQVERRAQIALYFGGAPVIGSTGIQAEFGTTTLGNFQDVITKVWAAGDTGLAAMGPIPDKGAAQLHITNLLHGSFGFLLEELDEQGEPLFETPLRRAADKAVGLISSFAAQNEDEFSAAIEDIDRRVFKALRDFFDGVHKGKATVRIVEGQTDENLDFPAIERAVVRLQASDVDDDDVSMQGRLLGVIPIARRFEFEADGRPTVVRGIVGQKFSQSFLERIGTQQFIGQRWEAKFLRKVISQRGREPIEKFTLLELDEIDKPGT